MPGARVAVLIANQVEYVEIIFGLARASMVSVPLGSAS